MSDVGTLAPKFITAKQYTSTSSGAPEDFVIDGIVASTINYQGQVIPLNCPIKYALSTSNSAATFEAGSATPAAGLVVDAAGSPTVKVNVNQDFQYDIYVVVILGALPAG